MVWNPGDELLIVLTNQGPSPACCCETMLGWRVYVERSRVWPGLLASGLEVILFVFYQTLVVLLITSRLQTKTYREQI